MKRSYRTLQTITVVLAFAVLSGCEFMGSFFGGPEPLRFGGNWELVNRAASFGSRDNPGSIVFDDRMWIYGGWSGQQELGDIWVSSNGDEWFEVVATGEHWGAYSHIKLAEYKSHLFAAGGTRRDGSRMTSLHMSTDGIAWSSISISTLPGISEASIDSVDYLIAANNRLYLVLTHSDTQMVFSTQTEQLDSIDALEWRYDGSVSDPITGELINFKGRFYRFPLTEVIWTAPPYPQDFTQKYAPPEDSTDLLSWTPLPDGTGSISDPPFFFDLGSSMVPVLNGIYVVAGMNPYNASGSRNTVWYTEDFVTWDVHQEAMVQGPTPRGYSARFRRGGDIYIAGGRQLVSEEIWSEFSTPVYIYSDVWRLPVVDGAFDGELSMNYNEDPSLSSVTRAVVYVNSLSGSRFVVPAGDQLRIPVAYGNYYFYIDYEYEKQGETVVANSLEIPQQLFQSGATYNVAIPPIESITGSLTVQNSSGKVVNLTLDGTFIDNLAYLRGDGVNDFQLAADAQREFWVKPGTYQLVAIDPFEATDVFSTNVTIEPGNPAVEEIQ